MKKYISILFAGLTLSSCVDTVILPDDKTVEEDYWKTEEQVESLVKGAYTAFASGDIMSRLIVWNSRSDEFTTNTSLSNSDLNQLYMADIQTTNGYSNWGAFYTCINRCNQIIAKSASVMDLDPNYLQGDHDNNVGQMLALRSLCYFYLIRAFHDVPLVLEPYTMSSQNMSVAQVAPGVVLNQIISDLEKARTMVLSSQDASLSLSYIKHYGFFTQDAVSALLADVYLWKGSIYRDKASYTRCIELCDIIHNNRKAMFTERIGDFYVSFDDDDYFLNACKYYYNAFTGIDTEDIFSILFTDNTSLCNMYFKSKNQTSAQPNFYTNSVYSASGTSPLGASVFITDKSGTLTDIRAYESVFSFGNAAESGATIRKYVALDGRKADLKAESGSSRDYTPYNTNFVIYRITDVMLMKAEALVQKARLTLEENKEELTLLESAQTLEDSVAIAERIQEVNEQVSAMYVGAARLAQIVNTRASTSNTPIQALSDSTKFVAKTGNVDGTTDYVKRMVSNFTTLQSPAPASDLEILILGERAREFCFESKRWYDMLRFNYRHTSTPANYDQLLADQTPLQNYSEFLTLMGRKYASSAVITSRLSTEPYLYMPIRKAEMEVNPLLIQNPVYKDSETTSKN